MMRAALLALVLALSVLWATDQVDAGGHADPDGVTATSDAGNHADPDG
jgi:hypothetical protein